jgi:exopolysaccharide biosynthesis polyprenyl glycosylphosphotransferase
MLNRPRHGIRVLGYYAVEVLVLTAMFFAGYWLRSRTGTLWGHQTLEPLRGTLWLLPPTLIAWSVFLWLFGSYDRFRSRGTMMHAVQAGGASFFGVLVLFALVTLLKHYEVNRSLIGVIGLTAFAGLFGTRIVLSLFLSHYTKQGYDRHYVIISGTHPEALALGEYLAEFPGAVFQIRGFVSDDPADMGKDVGRWKVLGATSELPAISSRMPVDEIYLLPPPGPLEQNLDLIRQCESMGISVHLRLAPFEKTISRLELVEAAGGDYLRFTTAPRSGTGLAAKRLLDVVGASLLLLLLSPLLLLAALLVKLTSRGPAVFRQERAGMNGRAFTLYKFRTMVEGAEKDRARLEGQNEMDGPVFKIKADPRITWLGKILRKTSVDELPQLWNVVKGDMSLVGPRPLPLYEVEKFEPWQRRRMSMRPGITCLWQVMGRNRVTSFAEWMRLDLEYVDRWSLGLDFNILLKTVPAVLGARGAY